MVILTVFLAFTSVATILTSSVLLVIHKALGSSIGEHSLDLSASITRRLKLMPQFLKGCPVSLRLEALIITGAITKRGLI